MIGKRLSHYEILEELGRGGMGEVYRAEDTTLKRQVALKVLPPDLASSEERLSRFQREAEAVAALNHPNIVHIYSVEEEEGVHFLTMELVEGRPLDDLIPQGGLSLEEFFGIATPLADAVAAAHERGIAHRDLKSGNVMVSDEGRVKVLDFGLAKRVGGGLGASDGTALPTATMTQEGQILGTVAYMSPEQAEGRAVDERSDIFSLGILLYEMATGERPFRGDTNLSILSSILKETPASVTDVKAGLPRHLGRILQLCLEKNPEHRFQSAKDVRNELEALERELRSGVEVAMGSPVPGRSSARRIAVLAYAATAAGVAAVIAAGLYLFPRIEPKRTIEGLSRPKEAISLAILPFQNTSGVEELDWLSSGLADILLSDIGRSEHLRTVNAGRLHQVLTDLRISPSESVEAAMRRRIADFCSAQALVWGRFVKVGSRIRIDATVEDLARNRQVPVRVEATSEEDLLDAIGRMATLVQESLALSTERVQEPPAQAFEPSSDSLAALRFYTQGLELLRLGNSLEAAGRFERSVSEDPDFAIAHSKLAEALYLTGRGREAEESSRRALRLSEGLAAQERNLIAAANARITHDLESGVEAYENLLAGRPDDPELRYELGALYASEGLFERAQEHFSRTLATDPQHANALLASGRALMMKGDSESALEPLNRALSLAVKRGNREMEAKALRSLGGAYRDLNRLSEALHNLERSLAISRQLGDRRGMAASMNGIAWVQDLSGDFDEARGSYEETIRLYRELGDRRGVGIGLMNLGDLERLRGNYEESVRLTREALQIQIDTNDEFNQALSLNNIGAAYYLQGKYDDALVYYQRALEIRERLEVPGEIADTLHNLGETYEITGRFERALRHLMRALELRRSSGDVLGAALESASIGTVFVSQGRYGAALSAFEEARAVFEDLGDRSSWYALALASNGHVLSLLGRGAEAAPIFEKAVALAEERKEPRAMVQVLNFKGERSFYAGDFSTAGAHFDRALTLAAESGEPLLELTSSINLARVSTALDRPSDALGILEAACGRSVELGLRVLASRCAIHREIARLSSGDREHGLDGLRQAIVMGEELTPPDLRARAHGLLARTLREGGDEVGADEHAAVAHELLETMLQEAGSDSLLERADLRAVITLRSRGAPPSGVGEAGSEGPSRVVRTIVIATSHSRPFHPPGQRVDTSRTRSW